MSAGQGLRRGYAYATSTSHSTSGSRSNSPDIVVLILTAFVFLVVVAVLSDEGITFRIGELLGALWSDANRLVQLLSGGAS